MPPDFPGLQGPVSSHSPYSFSVAPIRPPIPQFTTTTQFDMKTEPGQNITSESAINLGPNSIQEAKKELCENPTAPVSQEDIQKIQENNNNNQSENESSSEEVTPPKNQGLIKARGTYFPLTAFPTSMPQGPIMRRDSTPPGSERPVQSEFSLILMKYASPGYVRQCGPPGRLFVMLMLFKHIEIKLTCYLIFHS